MIQVQKLALSGDEAVAYAVKQCDVDLVSAYPITPQTIIVERISEFVASGEFSGEFVPVESEHSALSTCVGASLTGARVFTATASQGLALMHEILYAASGMRTPIVMAVTNRALNSPLSIHADHSDMMGSRDSGWIQIYVENVQEAYDRVIMAFKLAEDENVLLPATVNLDGFFLSHNVQPVEIIDEEAIHKFLGRPKRKYRLDPDEPYSFGAMAYPWNYFEFKYQQVQAMQRAYEIFDRVEEGFEKISGRRYGKVGRYWVDDADYLILIMGSATGTAKYTAKLMRNEGFKVGVLGIKLYRPFPIKEILEAIEGKKGIAVMDRSISYGAPSPPLASDIRSIMYNYGVHVPMISLVYGMGGRDFSAQDVRRIFNMLMEKDPSKYPKETVYYGVKI
jgi:pyruvate ferredoxin oxidoreductase alpha subunit